MSYHLLQVFIYGNILARIFSFCVVFFLSYYKKATTLTTTTDTTTNISNSTAANTTTTLLTCGYTALIKTYIPTSKKKALSLQHVAFQILKDSKQCHRHGILEDL